jgi:hypothetical protein
MNHVLVGRSVVAAMLAATSSFALTCSAVPIITRILNWLPIRRRPSSGAAARLFATEAMEEYLRYLRDRETIHATYEDYRAAATLDYEHDETDLEAGAWHVRCSPCGVAPGMPRAALRRLGHLTRVGRGVRGRGLECGHYLPEEAPEETLAELRAFFGT